MRKKVLVHYRRGRATLVGVAFVVLALSLACAVWLKVISPSGERVSILMVVLAVGAVAAALYMSAAVIIRSSFGDGAAAWLDGEELRTLFWSVKLSDIGAVELKVRHFSFTPSEVIVFRLRDGTARYLAISMLVGVPQTILGMLQTELRVNPPSR